MMDVDSFLPLDATAVKTIAVIGPFADFAQTGPSYTGLYSTFVKPLDGIRKRLGTSAKVLYARGSGILESDNPEASYAEAVGSRSRPTSASSSSASTRSSSAKASIAISSTCRRCRCS
jgi:hypothetical protein